MHRTEGERKLSRVCTYEYYTLPAHGHSPGHNLFGRLCKNRFVPAPFLVRRRAGRELTARPPTHSSTAPRLSIFLSVVVVVVVVVAVAAAAAAALCIIQHDVENIRCEYARTHTHTYTHKCVYRYNARSTQRIFTLCER
jgi:hypothetical protein